MRYPMKARMILRIAIVLLLAFTVLRPVGGLKAGRRGKQPTQTDAPAAAGPVDTGPVKKARQRQPSSGPTIGLLDPDIMARLASNAEATRNLNRFSVAAAVSRLQNTAYLPVGFAAQTSTVNRPVLGGRGPAHPEHMLIQPLYTDRLAAPNISDNDGKEWRSDFAAGYLYLPGVGDAVGGYMLGRILIKRLQNLTGAGGGGPLPGGGCCGDCYCTVSRDNVSAPWYLNAYVPYRYRHKHYMADLAANMSAQAAADQAQAALTNKAQDSSTPPTDLCVLEKWNRELPFTELPNMLLTFLANDDISGSDVGSKANFLDRATLAYQQQNKNGDSIFKIYDKYDELSSCSPEAAAATTTTSTTTSGPPTPPPTTTKRARLWYAAALAQWNNLVNAGDLSICGLVGVQKPAGCDYEMASDNSQEPFQTAMDQLNKLYTNSTLNGERMIQELADSAKACFHLRPAGSAPDDGSATYATPNSALIGCLDYSLGSGQVRNLTLPGSLFANEEICQRYLTPDLDRCAPAAAPYGCKERDIVNLNVFARNFYLCVEPVDQSIVLRVSSRKRARNQDSAGAGALCLANPSAATCAAPHLGTASVAWSCIALAISVISGYNYFF
ncbi:uncharacterized protein LOC129590879 isoform X2 [Paramacrobiotus metropolitanus]|uniref:uncharacterized protein LOC129590879 isoform X2 n=1 Tax=Paramacrobiotus metropolitanus TaxID=2943436 RepID=UPI002445CEE1|nr:uncharacterized protein LOC129590879 isoform X2 [Paramacrobiotus metropolitanus]